MLVKDSMLSKILSSGRLSIVIIVGLLLSATLSFSSLQERAILPAVQSALLQEEQGDQHSGQESPGLPVRLKIPTIHVDAMVESVGITADGAMDVLDGPNNVAWFGLGPRPGENGSAVLAGHYGWRAGSVFDRLHKLRKGDRLYIEDDKGMTTSFVVRKTRRYNPKANATIIFNSHDGKSHLNLITCEGIWNKASRSYSGRLVVFTDKE